MKKLTRVLQIDGVDVYAHWSTLVLGGALLLYAGRHVFDALALVGSYLATILIHEWGHVLAARRRRCVPYRVELYPIHGLTRITSVSSTYDEGVIAWGGSLLQLAVAAPLIGWTAVFGFTSDGPTNAVLAMLGYFGALVAIFNLCPASFLDGGKAWGIVPTLLRRLRPSRGRAEPSGEGKGEWIH